MSVIKLLVVSHIHYPLRVMHDVLMSDPYSESRKGVGLIMINTICTATVNLLYSSWQVLPLLTGCEPGGKIIRSHIIVAKVMTECNFDNGLGNLGVKRHINDRAYTYQTVASTVLRRMCSDDY